MGAINLSSYKLPPEEERTAPFRVVAHFLDWAAKHHPNQFVSWGTVTRIATGRSSTPRESSQDVKSIRRSASRVRRLLITDYNREMENLPGVGVRATTGSLDVIKTRVTVRQRQFETAAAGLQATAGLVDLASIPNTSETKPVKEWFENKMQPQLKKLEVLQRALALPEALQPSKHSDDES